MATFIIISIAIIAIADYVENREWYREYFSNNN